MDGALDVAADRQFLCAELALHLCPFGDHDGRGAYLSLDVTKDSIIQLTQALGEALDEKESLQAELAEVKGHLSTLVDWVMGDADALTTLQGVYLNPEE